MSWQNLLQLLRDRRSRRFAKGLTIPSGPLAYASTEEPEPLTDEETALLVLAATGITGWSLGMPYTASGDPDKGANYPVRLAGRTHPSAAGINGSELLVIDDTGVQITTFRCATAEQVEEFEALRGEAGLDLDELTDLAGRFLRRLSDERVTVPRQSPFVAAHNQWNANTPGSTLLVPLTDVSEQYLDLVSIVSGEGAILWDPAADEPIGDPTELLAQGRLAEQAKLPLAAFEQLVSNNATVESGLIPYNAQLMSTALGLGGWLFGGIDLFGLFGAYAEQGVPGLGFRFAPRTGSVLPNPVGLDGAFETLSAPYVSSGAEAVARFDALKFGPEGAYSAAGGGRFADTPGVLAAVERYDDASLAYFASVLDGLIARFNSTTGSLPTVISAAYYQAQHLDLGFYQAKYAPGAVSAANLAHDSDWH